jgi:acyl-coenzyme A synthetase/AMP-(fatty) acid ligase
VAGRREAAWAAQMADFKRPHEVRLVTELPRSTLEKIAKAELRKLLDREAPAGRPSPIPAMSTSQPSLIASPKK